jgi:hypothetical protein
MLQAFTMKSFTVIVLSALAYGRLFAQGSVNFANTVSTAVSNAMTGSPVAAGSTFAASIYYLPDTGYPPATTDFTASGVSLSPAVGFVQPGVFNGGTRTTPPSTPPGGSAYFQVRCWETAFGTNYEQAVTNSSTINNRRALVGTSNILKLNTGDSQAPASLVSAGLNGFYLAPLPSEPLQITSFSIDPVIQINTVVGVAYAVDKTLSLDQVDWRPVPGATNIVGTGGVVSVFDAGGGCLNRQHYRIRLAR